jgi:hypothetical protein
MDSFDARSLELQAFHQLISCGREATSQSYSQKGFTTPRPQRQKPCPIHSCVIYSKIIGDFTHEWRRKRALS